MSRAITRLLRSGAAGAAVMIVWAAFLQPQEALSQGLWPAASLAKSIKMHQEIPQSKTSTKTSSVRGGEITPQTSGTGTQGKLAKWVDGSGTLGDSVITDNGFLTIDSSNNPQAGGSGTLIIQGNANKERIELRSAGATPGPALQGRGFAGTIAQPAATAADNGLFIIGGSGYNGTDFVTFNAGTVIVKAEENWTPAANGAYIAFETTPSGQSTFSRAERMRITGSGNVGIGTAAPSSKLHVVGTATISGSISSGPINVTGDISATGNIAAKYQDVAEWVPASKFIPAGTVVVLDDSRSNEVIASSHAYDTKVAGVVSASPGVILGEGGVGKVMVATTGRVRVKVDASKGAIHVGDLLVTSDSEGKAMKSQPIDLGGVSIHRPGTLIGKALEPLDKGEGEILVLLSLQ